MKIQSELQDLTYLNWNRIRRSSGTAGSFLKAWETVDGKKRYYKLSNYNVVEGIIGHECINEIVVDRLLTFMGIEHLEYQLVHAEVMIENEKYETYVCSSMDYKLKEESKIPFDAFYQLEKKDNESSLAFGIRMGWERYLYDLILVDFLILNRDRHGANIEVLRNQKTKSLRLAPLFDHGLSLVFQCYKDKGLKEVKPLEDKPVQCFFGTHSTLDNLGLIPKEMRAIIPTFDQKLKDYLFEGLHGIVSEAWIDTVWTMLCKRAEYYESICN